MDNLFLLMILYLIYMGLSFWLFNGNFLSPSFVFSSSLSLMLCLAYYTARTIGLLFAIGIKTFSIFAFAGLVFIATELCVYLFRVSSCRLLPVQQEVKYEPLIVSPQIQFCATCFFALSLLIALYVLYINTGGSWSGRMRQYRELLLYNPDAIRFRFINAQLYKINIIAMDLFGYVMIYNLSVCNVPVRKIFSYIIDSVLYVIFCTVNTGARQSAIEAVLFLIMIYLSVNMKPGGRKKIYGFILRVIPVLIVMAALFTAAGDIVGRYKTEKSSLQNLAEYFCGGLYSFNYHIDDPATKYFGQATLTYVYAIPQNMGIIPRDDENMITGQFDLYGNTVTIFGRWYKDFGTIGVFVMT